MVGLLGLIMAGSYKDLATGKPFDASDITEMFSPLIYRKTLLALFVATGFAVVDIDALVSQPADSSGSPFTPRNRPLGYAALRARRYLMPVIVMLYLGLLSRYFNGSERSTSYITPYDKYIFIVLVFVARRPLNWTIPKVWEAVSNQTGDFLKPIANGR
jgi:hypothetical protein